VKLWLQYIEDYQESTKTEFDAPEWMVIQFGVWPSQFIKPVDQEEKTAKKKK
jgi:hypothetical protein